MRKSILLKALAPTLVLFSTQAAAVPFQSIDPRSLGMGGVGVASGTSANAGFMNPALLSAAHEDEDFSLELPILGARFSDKDDLLDEVDYYQDNKLEASLTTSIDSFKTAVAGADPTTIKNAAGQVATDADALLTQLKKLTGKPLQVEVFGGMVIGIPSKKVGASLTLNAYAVVGGQLNFEDQALMDGIITAANSTATGADLTALENNTVIADQLASTANAVDSLKSNLGARGAVISEVGLSLSREFNIAGHDVAVGITPKVVKVKTFHYVLGVNTADIDTDKGTKEFSDFNIDVGLAKNYGNGWKAGLVIKNLIGKEYDTAPFITPGLTAVSSATIKVDPQVRLGISHGNEWLTVAADLDITENEPVGFETKTQYLGLGVEADLFDWMQFRAGYRHNMSDSDTSIPTIGFGFSPFGVHIDLAYAQNGNEKAGSLQLGFRF